MSKIEPKTSLRINSRVNNDPYFASILNSNGEFGLGDWQIRITPNIVFVGKKSLATQIRQKDPANYLKVTPNSHIVENGIIIARIKRQSNPSANSRLGFFNGIDHTMYYWDGTHRSATVCYNDNWLVYTSLGVKVKFENLRWWGGWWQDYTDYMSMNWRARWDASRLNTIVGFVEDDNGLDCYNCDTRDHVIDFQTASIQILPQPEIDFIQDTFTLDFLTNATTVQRGSGIHDDFLEEH